MKYGSAGEARRDEARRGEATHPMLLLTERSASSLSLSTFYGAFFSPSDLRAGVLVLRLDRSELGRGGESRVAVGLVRFAMGYRHGFGFPLL
uniref:Uncharacterized protein n=1 Tax=Fagus sylvatica TaxID=28930 RepID=A0A2N9HC46_FAGSY